MRVTVTVTVAEGCVRSSCSMTSKYQNMIRVHDDQPTLPSRGPGKPRPADR